MPEKDFIIRDARSMDMDAMVGLLAQLFSIEDDFIINESKQRHGLAALLAGHDYSTIKVAEHNGKVIGMCAVQITVSTAEGGASALVEDLVVDTSSRYHGIGTALIEAALEWAVRRGCLRVQLFADKRNENALSFYRQRGWKTTNMICLTRKLSHWSCPSVSSNNKYKASARR
jgi:GNAT superfamily N-acetyltransferase